MSSTPYSMQIYCTSQAALQSHAVPVIDNPSNTLNIGRGDAPAIWLVDISSLLSIAWEPVTSGARPSYRWPTRRDASFTLQAIEGAAEVDELRRLSSMSANGGWPLQITVFHGDDPFTAYGYINGIAPSVFEWKDGNVLLECTAVIVSPWVKKVDTFTSSATFELGGDLPADLYYDISSSGGSFEITTARTTAQGGFANTYSATGRFVGDTTRRRYKAGAPSGYYDRRGGGAAGSGSYFLEKVQNMTGDNPHTLTIGSGVTSVTVLDNYSQPVWSVS